MIRAIAATALVLLGAAGSAQAPELRIHGPLHQGALVRGAAPEGTVALSLDGRPVPLAPDGRFLLGFDRDASASSRLVARLADGTEIVRTLDVAPRSLRIERLGIPRPSGGPQFRKYRLVAGFHLAGSRPDERPVRLAANLCGRRAGGLP